MDHNEATRLQAVEKYVLGEFAPELRDTFEEHYFDCTVCAEDVKAVSNFVDNTREVLQRQTAKPEPETVRVGGWFSWLRPVIAAPALAALLLVLAYQTVVTIPQAKQGAVARVAEQGTGPVEAVAFGTTFSLQAANNTRGGEGVTIRVQPKEGFGLQFDLTPKQAASEYLCRLVDEKGNAVLQVTLPGSSTNQEVHLAVPGGRVHAGKYDLVLTGGGAEVMKLTFTIEFLS